MWRILQFCQGHINWDALRNLLRKLNVNAEVGVLLLIFRIHVFCTDWNLLPWCHCPNGILVFPYWQLEMFGGGKDRAYFLHFSLVAGGQCWVEMCSKRHHITLSVGWEQSASVLSQIDFCSCPKWKCFLFCFFFAQNEWTTKWITSCLINRSLLQRSTGRAAYDIYQVIFFAWNSLSMKISMNAART